MDQSQTPAASMALQQCKPSKPSTGCDTCKARKVKCDERTGTCQNCERLGLECSRLAEPRDQSQLTNTVSSPTGAKRKRTYRSCVACRASKVRCSGEQPRCTRCDQRQVDCVYDAVVEPAWKHRLSVASDTLPQIAHDGLVDHHPPVFESHHARDEQLDAPYAHPGATKSPSTSPARTNARPDGDFWLFERDLPSRQKIKVLIEQYFTHVHPLRCFAFIHKPTFMQRVDNEESSEDFITLLHVICALGASFLAADASYSTSMASERTLKAGLHWAKRAQALLLSDLDLVSVDKLMTAVLLHDHHLRQGNFAAAFVLSGITARMAQALQLNLEHSMDVLCQDSSETAPTVTAKESRRRLMWSCYAQDAMVGSGVDQLTLVDEKDIKIQLPCDEQSFLLQKPRVTELLERGSCLSFLPSTVVPLTPADNMGMMSYYLRHMHIRKKVLKYIKRLNTALAPWLPESEFAALATECKLWHDTLPVSLRWTSASLYIRQETSQVGALVLLHFAYHQTQCDLFRIGAPTLYKVRSTFNFPPEQRAFEGELQCTLFKHARCLAEILAAAVPHGPNAFADSWLPTITYDSIRIMLYYLTQLINPAEEASKQLTREVLPLIKSNIAALKKMQTLFAVAKSLTLAAEAMMEKTGIESETIRHSNIAEHPYTNDPADVDPSVPGTPVQTAPDYVLNPLSIYRMARRRIPEKHAPETTLSPTASAHTTTPRSAVVQDPAPASGFARLRTNSESFMLEPSSAEQTTFEELQWLFSADPGFTWQPADTAVASVNENSGLAPWQSGAGISDYLHPGQTDGWTGWFQ